MATSFPFIRGKAFHGVRLLHIQLNAGDEFIFPHQMRKRLFPSISRDQFQLLKQKAEVTENPITHEQVEMINNSIGKSGGLTKVNENCTLILLPQAERLFSFLKSVDIEVQSKQVEVQHAKVIPESSNLGSSAVPGTPFIITGSNPVENSMARPIEGSVLNIEVKEFEGVSLLHILYESGYYMLLNQIKRLLFTGLARETLLDLLRKFDIKIHTLHENDCDRINSFLLLNENRAIMQGHNRHVDIKSPLLSKADASMLKATVENLAPSQVAGRASTFVKITEVDQCQENVEICRISREQEGQSEELTSDTSTAPNVMSAIPKFRSLAKEYKVLSPDPWCKPGPMAETRDAVQPMQNMSNASELSNVSASTNNMSGPVQNTTQPSTGEDVIHVLVETELLNNVQPISILDERSAKDPDYTPVLKKAKQTIKKERIVKPSSAALMIAKKKSSWYMKNSPHTSGIPNRGRRCIYTSAEKLDLSDLELHDLQLNQVPVENTSYSVGHVTLAGQDLLCIRLWDQELYCVICQVYTVFFKNQKGSYSYGNRKVLQKRMKMEECTITEEQYMAMITLHKHAVMRRSKLIKVLMVQKILASFREHLTTKKVSSTSPNSPKGRKKRVSSGYKEFYGVLLPYIAKSNKKWFILTDVLTVVNLTKEGCVKEDKLVKVKCQEKDKKMFCTLEQERTRQWAEDEMLVEEKAAWEAVEGNSYAEKSDDSVIYNDSMEPDVSMESSLPSNVNTSNSQVPSEEMIMEDIASSNTEQLSNDSSKIQHCFPEHGEDLSREKQMESWRISNSCVEPVQGSGIHNRVQSAGGTKTVKIVIRNCHKVSHLDEEVESIGKEKPNAGRKSDNAKENIGEKGTVLDVATEKHAETSGYTSCETMYKETAAKESDLLLGGKLVSSKTECDLSNSAFQTSHYVLIPKTLLQPCDSKCLLINRQTDKKLNITYVDKEASHSPLVAPPPSELPYASMDTSTGLVYSDNPDDCQVVDCTKPSGSENKQPSSTVGTKDVPGVAATNEQSDVMSYVKMFIKSQSMMKDSMTGLLQLTMDMQNELGQLEDELGQEREFNYQLSQQVAVLAAKTTSKEGKVSAD